MRSVIGTGEPAQHQLTGRTAFVVRRIDDGRELGRSEGRGLDAVESHDGEVVGNDQAALTGEAAPLRHADRADRHLLGGVLADCDTAAAVVHVVDPARLRGGRADRRRSGVDGAAARRAAAVVAGLMMLAPMLVVFLALQRRFVEGITASGLGGI
jgi:hypothetical protein